MPSPVLFRTSQLSMTGELPAQHDSPPPCRALFSARGDYVKHANDEILVFAMIETETAIAEPATGAVAWESVEVRRGQTLDGIFREQGFSISLLHEILALNGDTGGLTKIRPGDVFDFERHDDGSLKRMRYPLDEARYLLVGNEEGALSAEVLQRDITIELAEAEGIIDSSLFLAAKQAGLGDAMIMKLANIFGWDIDFVLDIRQGDRFLLVYEKLYREGEFLRDGRILAATFINQGERFQAIWFEHGDVADYFAPDGRNMRKAFLRAPLNFSYISSNYNPRRMHPVLKRVRPHNGTDYYAPPGTPVYAAGDGTVIQSAYSRAIPYRVRDWDWFRTTDTAGVNNARQMLVNGIGEEGQKRLAAARVAAAVLEAEGIEVRLHGEALGPYLRRTEIDALALFGCPDASPQQW